MTLKIDDRVEIARYVAADGKISRRGGKGRQMKTVRGTVVWVGKKFCTVLLDVGYRESFGYDEVKQVGRARQSA